MAFTTTDDQLPSNIGTTAIKSIEHASSRKHSLKAVEAEAIVIPTDCKRIGWGPLGWVAHDKPGEGVGRGGARECINYSVVVTTASHRYARGDPHQSM